MPNEDERGQKLQPPGRTRRQLRGDVEAVFGGTDLAAKHLRVDGVDVGVELLLAGDGAGDVIAGAEFAFGDLAVLRAGDERRCVMMTSAIVLPCSSLVSSMPSSCFKSASTHCSSVE